MDDLDTYIAVAVILRRHGSDKALQYCTKQAYAMIEAGDMEAQKEWQQIKDAVREMTRLSGDGDAVN